MYQDEKKQNNVFQGVAVTELPNQQQQQQQGQQDAAPPGHARFFCEKCQAVSFFFQRLKMVEHIGRRL